MLKIFIADDHTLIREGLGKIINKEVDMTLVGEAKDADELMKLIYQKECDILILDINMPDRSGLDLLNDIMSVKPALKVLILSMYPEDNFGIRAFKSGASGYISKGGSAEELIKAIRMISEGRKYISQYFAEKIVDNIAASDKRPIHELLSNREFQIFSLLAEGKTSTKIAEELYISLSTVNTHRHRILEKMNMNSNAELIHYAVKNRLIE